MTDRPLLIAAALADAAAHPSPQRWTERARAADAAGLDFVTIEPGPLDPLLLAARLAAQTTQVGIVPVVSTTTSEPFHVSTALATIDVVGHGRAGWLAEVEPAEDASGLVTWSVPPDVVADAAEHIDVVRALWDSWEDGAEIRDAATARFIDAGRVHHIDHRGAHHNVRGPSITPRPPQGHPVVAVRAGLPGTVALAVDRADVLVTDDPATPATPGLLRVLELDADALSPTDLVERLHHEHEHGFAGVLLHATDLDGVLATLRPLLDARATRPDGVTLCRRLGLPAAPNRFEATA